MSLLFNTAIAGSEALEASKASTGNSVLSFLPLIVLFFVFYFLILRPQQKKAKEEAQMRNTLRIGDKIVTTSGVFGSIVEIDDEKGVASIEIAKGVNILIYKTSIAETLTKKDDDKNHKPENKK